jgi:class 3 adenylate cyclase
LTEPTAPTKRRGLSLGFKAAALSTAVALAPVALAVPLLAEVNVRAVRSSEQMLQAAVLEEVVSMATRTVRDVEDDAVAIAALLGRAADGAMKDDDAIEAVRAVLATRDELEAVRFQVPSAHVSSVVRREGSRAEAPEAPPALRAKADARGVAFGPSPEGAWLVVARLPPSSTGKAFAGYVTAVARVDRLDRALHDLAVRRFEEGGEARVLLATADRRAVAASGLANAAAGSDLSALPVLASLPKAQDDTAPRFAMVVPHVEAGTAMVGAVETLPELGWVAAIWRPEPVAYAALAALRTRGALVAAAALVLALFAGLAAGRAVTRPVRRLVGETRLVAARRWRDLAPPSPRSDELGDLERALTSMAEGLERGEAEIAREAKLRGDLGRFVSGALVDALVRGDHPLALGGKRAEVSVLFADVVGFTPLAEARSAEEVVALLNELFSVLTEIVFRHGGTVDKFVGDCIMAVFGAPVPAADHARRALAAAEDMMRFLEAANDEWREKYDVEIRLGIGVNSGEAIVGNIGSQKRMEYTVIGDVVNVAARLEAIAAPNQVLVAEGTQRLVGDAFSLRRLGDKRLTGRKTETTVYALDLD